MISRIYGLRFLYGSFDFDDATYGVGTYGDELGTYGAEASQSVIAGVNYVLLPYEGWHPSDPRWIYRIGDESRFSTFVVDENSPSSPIEVSTIVSAKLILRQWTFEKLGSGYQEQTYDLFTDVSNNTLYRDWQQADLQTEGRFSVHVRIEFESGRYLTVESPDSASLNVNSGPDR